MGAQIAAWLAAAGVRVHLLDLASESLPEKLDRKTARLLRGKKLGRNAPAHLALARLQSLKPAPLTSCLLYTSPSPRDQRGSRMPSSA